MTRLRNQKALFFFLITAFLTMQWSSAHIHLAKHHDHDGNHHKHASQGHLHDLGSHHDNAIDVAHADDHSNVVELDHECTSPGFNKLDDLPVAQDRVSNNFQIIVHRTHVVPTVVIQPFSSWLNYSTVRLRAPPLTIS